MESLVSYYLTECAEEKLMGMISVMIDNKINENELLGKDNDGDGIPDEFFVDLGELVDDEYEFEYGDYDDEEELDEGVKARAPKLKGKAEKARKAKSAIMKSISKNAEIQGLIVRLKAVMKKTVRKESKALGVSGKAINKAINGKVKI